MTQTGNSFILIDLQENGWTIKRIWAKFENFYCNTYKFDMVDNYKNLIQRLTGINYSVIVNCLIQIYLSKGQTHSIYRLYEISSIWTYSSYILNGNRRMSFHFKSTNGSYNQLLMAHCIYSSMSHHLIMLIGHSPLID